MFGLVCDHAAEEPRERVLAGVRFCAVYVAGGNPLRVRLSSRAAARVLARRGVREAVFLAGAAELGIFAGRGITPISAGTLYRATAAAIVRRYLAQRGMDFRRVTLAFAAERVTAELCHTIELLSADVRYLVLCAPGGAALADRLQLERGVALRLCDKEPLRADLTIAFDGIETSGAALRLDDALCVTYDSPYPNELLTVLWRTGALDADRLQVMSVHPPESQEKTCKMPAFPV